MTFHREILAEVVVASLQKTELCVHVCVHVCVWVHVCVHACTQALDFYKGAAHYIVLAAL